MSKKEFTSTVAKNNLNVSYSGGSKTMFVKGNDEKVKSFIRVCNLKGSSYYPFKIAKG
jgi:hypothetical protein